MIIVEVVVMTEIDYERVDQDLLEAAINHANQGFDTVVNADGVFGPFDAHVLFKSTQISSCQVFDEDEIVELLGQIEDEEVDDDIEVEMLSDGTTKATADDETILIKKV